MKKMKEQTYGWYPSVRDIYISKNEPTPYHLECLYRFKESDYHNPIAEPPEPAFVIRGITPTPSPPPSRPASSRHSARHGAQSSTRRPKSVPVPKFRPVPKVNIPTPMQAWKNSLAETSWGVVTPGSTPAPQPATPQPPSGGQEEKTDSKPQVHWPTQQIISKYDKPYEVTATAEDVFGTPLPPRHPGSGGDSGYVFVPTGDGGVEVHSPPVYWPDSEPRLPTPQHSVSSKASLGSVDGVMARKKLQEQYRQQVLKEQEEKRKKVERQRRFEKLLRQHQQQQMKKSQPESPKSAAGATSSQSLRRERVKSATIHRHKTVVPHRPVYSARPSRPPSHTAVSTEDRYHGNTPKYTDTTLHETRKEEEDYTSPGQRPRNPLPPSPSLEDLVIEEDRSPSPDYQETVDTYGWRAEVHGDPYNIKKITKRLPYTVKCAEPVLAPEPPKVHMESKETFFLNTIPRRRATFDVQQEWLSEGLHAKRIELQKRDGVNYRYKTFGFAY